ncbi:MAG: carboxymuconolactone decarboxylase family protein [Hyphomicrobiaceae bacterium]|nr:carboxymuconolactone decarboxylase family protein [Hyphomicrobiaceae bacterium]
MTTPRMPPIAENDLTEEQKAAAATFAEGRGYGVRGPFMPLLRSPEVMLRAKAMGDYLRFKSVLEPRLSEMAILVTARFWSQNYEWHAHRPLAEKGGLNPAIADAIADGRRPENMADDEAALYDFSTELHVNRSVSDATYARAKAHFGEQGIIDLTALNGYYTLIAMVLNVGRVPLPEGSTPGMERFPK